MSDCATRAELERFIDGRSGTEGDRTIAAHIEECDACRRALEQLLGPVGPAIRPTGPDDRDARLIEVLKAEWPRGPVGLLDDATELDGFATGPRIGGIEGDGPSPAPALPGFRILRELGRGGMGVVYEADDLSLSRRVAVKILAGRVAVDPRQVQRFEREAKAAARLHHTHIIPVFGVGRHGGLHYYAMQYIEGQGLDRAIAARRPGRDAGGDPADGPHRGAADEPAGIAAITATDRRPSRAAARIGLAVAEAIAYAHEQGVLHRDIKPSNLLLDATGHVWVADFGLAKTPDSDDLTSTGDVLGTIRYMAPERFAGRCDARSDVYGLGLTLYELVAGRPAYEADDRYALIERVRRADPPPLGKVAPAVPRDLETIIHKAIAADPAHRYADAAAMAEDLRRFLEDRPIRARPASLPGRLVRWGRRNPWAAAFLAALAMGLLASTWQAVRATRAERDARAAEFAVRSQRDRAERSLTRATKAIQRLLFQEGIDEAVLRAEEMRPYRRALIEAGLQESREMIRELEGDDRWEGLLVEAYHTLGSLQRDAGEPAAAIESARKAVDLAGRIHDRHRDPGNAHALAHALQLLGSLLPDPEASRDASRRSAALFRELIDRSPGPLRRDWAGMAASTLYNTGDRLFLAGRHREAIEEFRAARAACESCIREYGPSPPARLQLALSERYLCRALHNLGRRDEARIAGRRAVEGFRSLYREHPEDIGTIEELALAEEEIGQIELYSEDPTRAIPEFDAARRTLEALAARPGLLPSRRIKAQIGIARQSYNAKCATDADPARFPVLRRELMARADDICRRVSLIQPLDQTYRMVQATACFHMAEDRERTHGRVDLAGLLEAERLWPELGPGGPRDLEWCGGRVIVRQQIAEELSARGRADAAARWRREAMALSRGDPGLLFDIAVEYARYVLDAGAPSPELPDRAEARRERFTRYSLLMLREAAAAGFRDAARLGAERLLAPIRSRPEFRELVSDLAFPADPFARP